MNDVLDNLLDNDRPIPLGRGAGPATVETAGHDADPAGPAAAAKEPPASPLVPAGLPEVALGTDVEPLPVARRVASRWPAGPPSPAPRGTHPLTGLRGFRLEPVAVERPDGGRHDLARFLISFALVMAFVYALIVAFVLLVAHVRGTPV